MVWAGLGGKNGGLKGGKREEREKREREEEKGRKKGGKQCPKLFTVFWAGGAIRRHSFAYQIVKFLEVQFRQPLLLVRRPNNRA